MLGKLDWKTAWIVISVAVLMSISQPVMAQGQAPRRFNIAVLDLELDKNVPEEYQITLSNRLRQELINTGRFTVIERGRMQDILAEQGLQLSGCTSDECVIEAGRLLGVEQMVAGSVGRVGNTYSVILRRIDVESGQILDAQGVDCPCEIEEVMTSSLKTAATLIAGLGVVEKAPARPHVFPRSLIVPGWGQRASGRPLMGWTLTGAQLATLGYFGYAAMNYSDKLSKYNDAKAAYETNEDPTIAQKLYDDRIAADKAAADANSQMTVAAAAAAGVYVLNLIDGIFIGGGNSGGNRNGGYASHRPSIDFGLVQGDRSRAVPAVSLVFSLDARGR
jgi:TolB-like protein